MQEMNMQATNQQQRERGNVERIDTSALQGAGSWVDIKTVSWGESKRLADQLDALGSDRKAQTAFTEKLVIEHVVAWNWRGDREGDLPIPKDDPSVLDELTAKEVTFLTKHVYVDSDPKA